MRREPFVALLLFVSFAVEAAPWFEESPYRAEIPDYRQCDVIVNPSNYMTTLAQYSPNPHVNDPTKRVFCVEPGDYRGRGDMLLLASGTASNPRFLRFRADDGVANAAQRSQRAIFERIVIAANWWVIQGLTIQPRDPDTSTFLLVYGGDHNVLDGNLVDGALHSNVRGNSGIAIKALDGEPATYNTVQRNLIRNGNRNRLDVDYFGVLIGRGSVAGEDNDGNRVVDNEIADWGDGVAVGSNTDECLKPAVQHGTVIDGNDIYLTSAMRVDCSSGDPDPNGGCACAENGIDVKGDPGSNAGAWTRLTRNRVWGYRPTLDTGSCGGSGSNGQAITAGNSCTGHVLVAENVVMDSTIGIAAGGSNWIVTGNLLHGIRAVPGLDVKSLAIHAAPAVTDVDVQFNTMVRVDSSYDDGADNADTRCNVVIDDAGLIGYGLPRGENHATPYNSLYDAPSPNFLGSSNRQYAAVSASNTDQFCFWRRRWSSPEEICIPRASTTSSSPHVAQAANCNLGLATPFGLPRIGWPSSTPCDDGIDNDGDGAKDLADPGCASTTSRREDPGCQNGVDDDGDGRVDFDGGRSVNGGVALAAADAQCASAPMQHESGVGCGIGCEIAAVLFALRHAARRRRVAMLRAAGAAAASR